jgi:iron complex transport system ATP-binding protein
MIEARQLSFTVGQAQILQDISCTAQSGEILGVLGPNGAGKSTLLKCLSGFKKPTRGSIYLNDRDLNSYSLVQLSRLRAVLTQQVSINFPFKVHEIVAMGRGNFSNRATPNNYDITLATLELTQTLHLKDRLISTLSGGEQQRVT